jgi:GMP synthase (glutamine-hydrolysing)
MDPVFRAVPNPFVAMHWHGDTFDLPAGAELLASSEQYPNQAFRYGKNVYAFQFHVEANQRLIDTWAETDPGTLEKAGITREALRKDTAHYLPDLIALNRQIWQNLEPIFFEEE